MSEEFQLKQAKLQGDMQIKQQKAEADMALKVALIIANADGDFSEPEKAMVERIRSGT